jgi:FixJ family two-component response regulator
MPGETPRALVAVVEDDPSSRLAIGRLLRAEGFDTALFDSAEAFIASPPVPPPACLILDVQLPGMSGIELQEHLRSEGRDVPVIITTGNREAHISERARLNGCAKFFWKPLDAAPLLAAIASIVGSQF